MEWLVAIAFWCLIWGGIAALIGQRKNLGAGGPFALGVVLGIIGVIIVICQKSGLPPAPSGMRAVKCPRCNAVQNIAWAAPSYDCWQCHQAVPVQVPSWLAAPNKTPAAKNQPTAEQSRRSIQCPLCDAKLSIATTTRRFKCSKCKAVSNAPHA